MRRWLWALLAPLGVVVALVIAFSPFGGNGFSTPSGAADPGDIDGNTVVDSGDIHFSLDMDVTDGTGPCNPITATANHLVDPTTQYAVAVCLVSAGDYVAGVGGGAPASFGFNLLYDKTLNQCVPGTTGADAKPGFDFNPDANEGATTFTSDPLGDSGDWDCTSGGAAKPSCDKTVGNATVGTAFISCGGPNFHGTLPVGDAVAAPVAEVYFKAIAVGQDNMTLDLVAESDFEGNQNLTCPPSGADPNRCFGGTDVKDVPTDTPTATETPTPTDTNTPGPATATFTPTATATFTPTPTFTPIPPMWAYIDKDLTNGSGPCDQHAIDSETTEYVGQTHQLAVCVGNVPAEIDAFTLDVTYDPSLDECVTGSTCSQGASCLDSNPDANAGSVVFGADLGAGWNCNLGSTPVPPACGSGAATISCERALDDAETAFVADGLTDHIALAAINFNVIGAGTDTVRIRSLQVSGADDVVLGQCGAVGDTNNNTGTDPMRCQGATDNKVSQRHHRTATPEDTSVPTETAVASATPLTLPTAAPSGGAGPAIVAPGTGGGPNGGSFPWALALLAAAAASCMLAGGVYLGLSRMRSEDR